MIRLSNGHGLDHVVSSGSLAYDGKGWPWERPMVDIGLIRPDLFTVVLKTLTRSPREGNLRWHRPWSCVALVPGGAVNKVGLTNPGIDWWCRDVGPKLDFERLRIVASIFGDDAELAAMAEMLNGFGLSGLEVNPSCPNTGHALQTAETVVRGVRAVKAVSRHPIIVKVSTSQDYLAIARGLKGVAEAVALNSVPWEQVYPDGRSPLWRLERRVGGGGGGVSGRPAPARDWGAVRALAAGGAALPADEDGAAEPRHLADHRPAADILLGDEAGEQQAAQHRHVEPGGVVRGIHHRAAPSPRRRADDAYRDPHQPAVRRPVHPGEARLAAARQRQQHRLDDRGDPGPGEDHQPAPDHPEPSPQPSGRGQRVRRAVRHRRRADPCARRRGGGCVRLRPDRPGLHQVHAIRGASAQTTRCCLHRSDIARSLPCHNPYRRHEPGSPCIPPLEPDTLGSGPDEARQIPGLPALRVPAPRVPIFRLIVALHDPAPVRRLRHPGLGRRVDGRSRRRPAAVQGAPGADRRARPGCGAGRLVRADRAAEDQRGQPVRAGRPHPRRRAAAAHRAGKLRLL